MDPGKTAEVLLKLTDNITSLTQMYRLRNTFKKLRDEEEEIVLKVLILFNTDVIVDWDEQLLYNSGYLVFQRIFH